jgi:acyl-CoA thioesterase FadM
MNDMSNTPTTVEAPHNLSAEAGVLGAVLYDNNAFQRVADILRTTDFYSIPHQEIFEVCATMIQGGRVADGIVNMLARLHGPEGLEARMEGRIGGAVVEYRLHYHRRPRSGDLITVRTGVRAITGRTHRLVHWLFDARSGECLCSSEAVAVTLDLQTRRAVELPEAQRRRMEAFVIAEPGG